VTAVVQALGGSGLDAKRAVALARACRGSRSRCRRVGEFGCLGGTDHEPCTCHEPCACRDHREFGCLGCSGGVHCELYAQQEREWGRFGWFFRYVLD